MSSNTHMTRPLPIVLALVAQGLFLGGCGKQVAEATGFATTPQQAKPFVQESRRAEADYIPVGSSATRAAPRKQLTEFKALETELEAKRRANEAAGTQARQFGATQAPAPVAAPPVVP